MATWKSVLRTGAAALVLALAGAGSAPAWAATQYTEAKGAADHPLVSRYQGAILFRYGTINFDHVDVKLASGKTESMEGKLFNYYYLTPKDRTALEVYRNYKQALEKQRFTILAACEDVKQCPKQGLSAHARKWTDDARSFVGGSQYMNNMDSDRPFRFLMARLERPAGDVTVIMTLRDGYFEGYGTDYFMQIIEAKPMETNQVTVNADALGKGLNADGKISLYGIFFDTAKADIKPESKPQLDEMAKLLTQNAAMKVYIVGHTDNQGGVDANLSLSQKRAEAIVQALVKEYKIAPARLAAKGVANYAPVASNAAEAGRAQNRRVELVTQ